MDDTTRTLHEYEQIRQLKYRYFRAVDTHDWALLADCLTDDCEARLYGGRYAYDGRDAFVSSLRALIGKPTFLTMHHGHHPGSRWSRPITRAACGFSRITRSILRITTCCTEPRSTTIST